MEREIRVCATCNKGDHTGKDCPTRPGCFTPDYVNWEPIAEKPEKGKTDFTSRLIMEDWEISWGDEDHISIVGPHNQICTMAGGDFESLLSALCGAYNRG